MSYPAYPEVKPSGVEWLGAVPQGWEVASLKRYCRIINGATPSSGTSDYWDGDITWITPDDLGKQSGTLITTSSRKITDAGYQNCGTQMAPIGSLVVSTRAPIGHLGIAGVELCTNQGCRSLVFTDLLFTKFAFYLLKAGNDELKARGNGSTFQELSKTEMGMVTIALPPLPEQQQIAAFLDCKTAELDAVLALKERQLELLAEKRQALISQAVTRGVDPAAPLKPSGVDWLGDVPRHWAVVPIWMLFSLGRGRVISNLEILDNPGPYPVYSSQTEENGVMGYLDTHDFEGDYLTWTTDGAKAGTVFFRSGKFNCTNVCGTLKAKSAEIEPEFFRFALSLATPGYVRYDINPKLMNDEMAHISIPRPPFDEQIKIAAYLNHETASLDGIAQAIRTQIEKVREYRQALISAAVTGKIDVREMTAEAAA